MIVMVRFANGCFILTISEESEISTRYAGNCYVELRAREAVELLAAKHHGQSTGSTSKTASIGYKRANNDRADNSELRLHIKLRNRPWSRVGGETSEI
jgi:hypothetical protein